jgi:diguanylate cyclase (GGDEF)-like protein
VPAGDGSAAADPAAGRRPPQGLADWLLSTDPVQRLRLAQASLAMLMLAVGVLTMHFFVWSGTARPAPVLAWSAISLGGMAVFWVLIRSGWSRRLKEPSLTVPQMLYALGCGALAYAILGEGRGGVFPIVMVILMFGMFVATPAQMRWVSLFAVLLFGATMGAMAWVDPKGYPWAVEIGHFLMIATMVPAVSVLAGRLCTLRQRARQQRTELAQALGRIRELATRDELTGLVNRRHMQDLMEQEHQRCIRSGQTFCLALLDLDHLKPVNQAHGYPMGDQVLRAFSTEAQRHVRLSDALARWSGQQFVLMLADTRAALARGGLERMHHQVSGLRIVQGDAMVAVTVSAGLAEHHAGETVVATLERARRALAEAKALGGARVVVAA